MCGPEVRLSAWRMNSDTLCSRRECLKAISGLSQLSDLCTIPKELYKMQSSLPNTRLVGEEAQ